MQDISELIKEVSKRDKIITNLLTGFVVTKLTRYGHGRVCIEDAIKMIDLHTTFDLDNFTENMRDEALRQAFIESDHSSDTNVIKAEKLQVVISNLLDGSYERNLKNELKIAIDQKRISLMKS